MKAFEEIVKRLQKDDRVPEEVWKKYTDVLERLPDKQAENRTAVKRKRACFKVIASAAVIAALLGVGVYAAGKYFGGREESLAEFEAEEALYDEEKVRLVIQVSAKEKGKYLFMPTDASEKDSVREWGLDSELTAKEYADQKDLELILINIGIATENLEEFGARGWSEDFQAAADDVMNVTVEWENNTDPEIGEVLCHGIVEKYKGRELIRTEFPIQLPEKREEETTTFWKKLAAAIQSLWYTEVK